MFIINYNPFCKSFGVISRNVYSVKQSRRLVGVNLSRYEFPKESLKTCVLSTNNHHRYNSTKTKSKFLADGPNLRDFITANNTNNINFDSGISVPYLSNEKNFGLQRKVYFDVHGCQMNVNDTEIIWSILRSNGYLKTDDLKEADIVLIVTCSIRDGAEAKIWNKINHLKGFISRKQKIGSKAPLKIGILGCMAERLKHKLIEKEHSIDLVAGPDSYKDLPRLLALTENNQKAVNVLLSLDETYADIIPVRLNINSVSAFVSIMRGCDNMCTYCIVPFTRGRERSRPVDSIVTEINKLVDQGVKEVTLLGQNVNSYRDNSQQGMHSNITSIAKGFRTVYRHKVGGLRFADLLERVSNIHPELRVRFTSPHPKDFPDEVLQLIRDKPNICKNLHLPAQSGNSEILERMRRGYTREAYLELVDHIRDFIPSVSLSSDFICGFCGETEKHFRDTLSLMKIVGYNTAYIFPYSMREKTTAHRRYIDDVPQEVKLQRLEEMKTLFRNQAAVLNNSKIGKQQLILIEGDSKRSSQHLVGRNDNNIKVIIPKTDLPTLNDPLIQQSIKPGDYIVVNINAATSQVLKGNPLYHTTLTQYHNNAK